MCLSYSIYIIRLLGRVYHFSLLICYPRSFIATGQGDVYTTGCLLDYPYFKKYYKLIAIDLTKQQKLDADRKAIQQINFTGNLDAGGSTMLFIIEEAKETVFDFSKGTVKVL